MGSMCSTDREKSMPEITPSDFMQPPADLIKRSHSPAVQLYGCRSSVWTFYVRFALLYKPIALQFIPKQTTIFGSDIPVIHFQSDVVSGSVDNLFRYVDSKFPAPPLVRKVEEKTPAVVRGAVLHHRSIGWHLERMVRWAEDLAARGGEASGNPVMGSPRMEVRKFAKSYSQLLELMLEHAQMEERVVFPILEKADPGICKAASEEHARELPIMNGIKEEIKSIVVLDSGTPSYQEALINLSNRLNKLQKHCKEHFDEEERELLPLMEAAELSREQQVRALEQCLHVMTGTHSHLFPSFIEGLLPQDAIQYMELLINCIDEDRVISMFEMIIEH